MDHTHIVQASDLDRYAPTRDSQAVIPELVYLLVKASCPSLAVCRIPYGDAVNQPGLDGRVETEDGFREFVPKGRSYWEIGTGADPQGKATEDFKKRTKEISDGDRAESSFVFVTPRSSGSGGWNDPEQTSWIERRKNTGWKLIRIIDGVKFADWLREYPAIGKWMATKIPLTRNLGGLSTAAEHWENLSSECGAGDPPFPPKLFIIGRAGACEALQALFAGKTQTLMLFAESPQDVADFVAAFLAGLPKDTARDYGNRCLYINDEQAWRSIAETRAPHILVADPRLALQSDEGAELQALARRKGHALVVPLSAAWSGNSPEILKLRSPSQSQIELALKEAGYTEIRAKELGSIGADRLSALRRYLRGYGTLPPYAIWDNATLIAQAGLAGKWAGSNPADRSALEMLLGKKYGEWIEILRPDTLRSDSPLIQNNENWRIVARGEVWNFLGNRISDDDMERFRETALHVLGERDPKFDLPKEERFSASIHGKALTHSHLIRTGIAETLALMGSRPGELSSCSDGKVVTTAILTVRYLLGNAKWDLWASLDNILPLLAEAAPDEFLDAVESALLNLSDTPFHKIFEEEGGSGFGRNYMSGILWALETLAWSPEFLSRVSVILADMASFDPGGNWGNRPSNSLIGIFLPWHVQTTATPEKRKAAIEAVIKEHPGVGWNLLLGLLPHGHGSTSGCHRPVWRNFIPRDWKDGVTKSEYWEQITAYTNLAVTLAKRDLGKLRELIKKLSDLPQDAHESLLEHLSSGEIRSLPEVDRLPLWEELDSLVRSHRKFSNARWAMPNEMINKISSAAAAIAPTSPAFKYHHLFSSRDFDLFDDTDNFDEQRKRLDKARHDAITEIFQTGGVAEIFSFAENVSAPLEIGRALGITELDEIEAALLPRLLDSEDDTLIKVVAGFIWARYWKLREPWADAVLKRHWSPERQAKFLTFLPFEGAIWERVSACLGGTNEALYWKNVKINPYVIAGDLTTLIEKLLEYGRKGAAVMCAACTDKDKSSFNEALATKALLAVLGDASEIAELDSHQTVELIKRLQESDTSDKDSLFLIEWHFLPWLDRFSSGSPVTLEKRLASDPSFFAEVIGLVFRSKNVGEIEGLDEHKKNLAKNAYKLLTEWRHCPGKTDDKSFSAESFDSWINEARRLTEESGHAEVAQIQIGHVLTCAPPDPDGFWIHHSVATVLNLRDTGYMRSGFTTQLYNDRGVHGFTHGQEERDLASKYREKSEFLDSKGYTRFATQMREFAERYERDAEREAKRDPFED